MICLMLGSWMALPVLGMKKCIQQFREDACKTTEETGEDANDGHCDVCGLDGPTIRHFVSSPDELGNNHIKPCEECNQKQLVRYNKFLVEAKALTQQRFGKANIIVTCQGCNFVMVLRPVQGIRMTEWNVQDKYGGPTVIPDLIWECNNSACNTLYVRQYLYRSSELKSNFIYVVKDAQAVVKLSPNLTEGETICLENDDDTQVWLWEGTECKTNGTHYIKKKRSDPGFFETIFTPSLWDLID